MGKGDQYQIRLNLIEARELKGRNESGTSDPICVVSLDGERKSTDVVKKVNSVLWNRTFLWNKSLSEADLKKQVLTISVFDSNTIRRNVLIGSFEMQLSNIYAQQGHEYYRKWVTLVDTTDSHEGVQGFVLLSVAVLGPGDELPTHDEGARLTRQSTLSNLQSLVLTAPSLKTTNNYLRVKVFKGEGFPKMDTFGSIDAYVQVRFAGNPPLRTETIPNNPKPEWNEELMLPVTTPIMADYVEIGVYDYDKGSSDDLVGVVYVPFAPIQKNGGTDVMWLNVYGGDRDNSGGKVAEAMNEGHTDPIAYRGRIQVSFTFEQATDTKLYKQEIVPPKKASKTAKYTFRADVYAAADIPSSHDAILEFVIGEEVIASAKGDNKGGSVSWYQAMDDVTLDLPDDPTQVPDVFVYLKEKSMMSNKRLSVLRLKAIDLATPASKPEWVLMSPDPLFELGDGQTPGVVLMNVALGKTVKKASRPKVEAPEMAKFQLRAHIYQGRNLSAADDDGLSDPYAVVRLGPKSKKTAVINKTLFPEWMETITLNVELPKDPALRPDVTILLYDHDRGFASKTFLGRFTADTSGMVPDLAVRPAWFNLYQDIDDEEGASKGSHGAVLASFQLIPDAEKAKYAYPDSLRPASRDAIVEINAIGLRELVAESGSPGKTHIEFDLGNRKHVVKTETSESSGDNPNFLQTLELAAKLPDDSLYAPSLNIRVFEHRLIGGNRLMATGHVPLAGYMPWTPDKPSKNNLPREFAAANIPGARPPRTAARALDSTSLLKSAAAGEADLPPPPPPPPPEGATVDGDASTPLLEKQTSTVSLSSRFMKGFASVGSAVKSGASSAVAIVRRPEEENPNQVKKSMWNSFLGSSRTMPDVAENVPAGAEDAGDGDDRPRLNREIELELGDIAFDEFPLYRGKALGMGTLQKLVGSAGQSEVGSFKGLVRVIDVKKRKSDKGGPTLAEKFAPKDYIIRAYVLSASQLVPFDDEEDLDTYVVLSNGEGKAHNIRDKKHVRKDTLYPEYQQMYRLPATLPGDSELKISIWDSNMIQSDSLIGSTSIDVEAMWFSKKWQKMKKKPIEHRTLWNPSTDSPQGKLELWTEILTPEEDAAIPPVPLGPEEPHEFELRCVVWNSDDVKFRDKKMSDIFIVGGLEGHEPQKTDIHWRSENGEGAFNYRLVFPTTIPNPNPYFRVQVFDKDVFNPNDVIAEAVLNLGGFFRRAYKKGRTVELKKQWISLYHPNYKGEQGRVELEFSLLTAQEAKVRPAGLGREEPNAYPELPEPVRPETSYNPFRLDKMLYWKVWREHRWRFYLCFAIILLLVLGPPILRLFTRRR